MAEEEDIYFDDDDGQDQEPVAEDPNPEEEETAEGKYERAKGLLGFSDLEAIDLFYEIYCDLSAPVKLQGKALKRAAITLSQTDDYERIMGSLTDVFTAYSENTIDNALCTKIVRRMMSNVRNEQALSNFLEISSEKIDKSNQLQLYVDIKIRQAEMSLKNADYTIAQNQLSEVENFVQVTPDSTDKQMLNSKVHVLLLKIQLAQIFTKDEQSIFEFNKELKAIPNVSLNQDYQNAVLLKIDGQELIHKGQFEEAIKKLHEAFKLFDKAGNDGRVDCLPFLALAIMATGNTSNMIFNDSQMSPYVDHPIVCPLKQLNDTFKLNNYVKYEELLPSAKNVFLQKVKDASCYFKLLDQIRLMVLQNNVQVFCPSYKRVELQFLTKELKCKVEEARRAVFDLIINRKLNALYDTDSNVILMQEIEPKSIYLQNVELMINSLNDTIVRQTKRDKIHFT